MLRILTSILFLTVTFFAIAQDYRPSGEIINEGIEAHDKGDYDKAIKLYRQVHQGDTNYDWAEYEISLSLLASKDYEATIKHIEKVLDKGPSRYGNSYYSNLATAYDNSGNEEKAVEIYKKGIELYPMDYNLWFNLGITYEGLEKYDEAVEQYKAALARNPFHSTSHLRLGALAANEGRLAMAMMSYNAFLLMEPNTERSFNLLVEYNSMVGSNWSGDPKGTRFGEDGEDDFSDIDNIIKNRIALDKKYKTPNKLKLNFVKQNYALLQALENKSGEGFWYSYYVPFFQAVYKDGKFNDMAYYMLMSVEDEKIQKVLQSNINKIKNFPDYAGPLWRSLHQEVEMDIDGEMKKYYVLRDGGKVSAVGTVKDRKMIGTWRAYNNNGSLSAIGNMNDEGNKSGKWRYYFDNSVFAGVENYEDGALQGPDSSYYINGNLKSVIHYNGGAKEGDAREYFLLGMLNSETFNLNNKLNGNARYYYELGPLHYDVNYKDGQFEGDFKEYYPNGALKLEKKFKEGKSDGKSIEYFPGGQVESDFTFVDGKREGPYKMFYPDGTLKEEGEFKNDVHVNTYKEYYRDGILLSEGTFDENGKKNGTETYYDYDGKKHYELLFKNGEIIEYRFFDKSGNIIKEGKKKGGKFQYVAFYPDGTKMAEGLYQLGDKGKTGEWRFYDQYGVLSDVELYDDGTITGQDRAYWPSGTLKSYYTYENGEMNGPMESFYKNGDLYLKGYHVDDEAEGLWRYYYQDGTLKETVFFLNDDRNGPNRNYDVNGKLYYTDIFEYGQLVGTRNHDTLGNVIKLIDFQLDSTTYDIVDQFGNKKRTLSIKNYQFHGPFTSYYADGTVKVRENYFNNSRQGDYVSYHPNGKKEQEGRYDHGNRTGKWTLYWENGKVKSIRNYVDGNLHGEVVWYHENGKTDTKKNYRYGEEEGPSYYYDGNGVLQHIRYYKNGKIIGYANPKADGSPGEFIAIENGTASVRGVFPNGKPSREYELVQGVFQGDYKEYYENGQLFSHYVNVDGETHGEQLIYYPNGKLKKAITYVYDERSGVEKRFRKDGTLEMEITWKLNLKHGETRYYDASGKKVVKKERYYNGRKIVVQ